MDTNSRAIYYFLLTLTFLYAMAQVIAVFFSAKLWMSWPEFHLMLVAWYVLSRLGKPEKKEGTKA